MTMDCDCLIFQPIAESATRRLVEAGLSVHVAGSTQLSELGPYLATARAVITRNHGISAVEIAAGPNLRVVGVHGTGTDKVDKAALAERGITLVSTPGANAQSVAELTILLMLACGRALTEADQAARQGDHSFRLRRQTMELAGKRLGLIGYGHIARMVGRFAKAIGMEVGAFSHSSGADVLEADGVLALPGIDDLCLWADIVSLHGRPEAMPIIDARRLELIGSAGIIINTARGALVDELALTAALKAGVIAGAGLDALTIEPIRTEDPLLYAPNLIVTPHIGGSTVEALEKTGHQVVDKVLAFLSNAQGEG